MSKKKTVEASSFLKNKAKEDNGSSVNGAAASSNKASSFLQNRAKQEAEAKKQSSIEARSQERQTQNNLNLVSAEENNLARKNPLTVQDKLSILAKATTPSSATAKQDIIRRDIERASVGVKANQENAIKSAETASVLNRINAPSGAKTNMEAGNASLASVATKTPMQETAEKNFAQKYPYLANGSYDVAKLRVSVAKKRMDDAYDRASKLDNTYYGELPNEQFKAALAEAEKAKQEYEDAIANAEGAEKDQNAFLIDSGEYRKAGLADVTLNSFMRGIENSIYGRAAFNKMFGGDVDMDAYEQRMNGERYKFVPQGTLAEAVSGATELVGQQAYQWANPRSQASAWAAVGAALLAGNAGPQALLPEEVVTLPSAYALGLNAASSVTNAEIEAGQAYMEMLDAGVSEDTARKLAMAVGGVNGILEFLQMDEAVKGIKALSGNEMTKGFARNLAKDILDRGLDVGNETLQEVLQEATTIHGVNMASKIDTGEKALQNWEVEKRLKDTATSSALTFGLGAITGLAGNYAINNAQYSVTKNKAFNELYKKLAEGSEMTADEIRVMGYNIETDFDVADEQKKAELIKQATDLKEEAKAVAAKVENGTATQKDIGKFLYDAKQYSEAYEENGKKEEQTEQTETKEENTETKEETKEEPNYGMNVAMYVAADLDRNGQSAIARVLSNAEESKKGNMAVAFQRVYDVGRYNMASKQDEAYRYAEMKGLTSDQISMAFRAGQMDYVAEAQTQNRPVTVTGGATQNVFKTYAKSPEVTKYLSGIGGKLRINVDVDAKMSQNEGAKWNKGTRTLTINPNAKDVVGSLWHDMTHVIQDTSINEYIEYRDFVVDFLSSKQGIDKETFLENMIAKYQARYESHAGEKKRRSQIIDEIVSDAAMEFSTDESAVKKFIKEHSKLASKILDFFDQVIDALNSYFGRSKGNEVSAKLKEDMAAFTKARDLFYKGIEAVSKSKTETKTEAKTQKINEGFIVDSDGRFSLIVEDADELKFLNDQLNDGEVTEVYRAMQLVEINGEKVLVPPMAGKVKDASGKWVWQNPSRLNKWEMSEEIKDFDSALKNGTVVPTVYDDGRKGYKFNLKKGQSGMSDVPAAYNPYIHTSLSTLNDQFTSAYKRPNLVIVKGYVPNSEINGDSRIGGELYGADYAKDKVGRTKWHSGVVAAQMPETREVILSRYFMPVEILSNETVAKKIKEQMKGKDIVIPFNVVSPGLRRALENEGVRIGEGQGIANLPSKDSVRYSLDSTGNKLTSQQAEYFKDSKKPTSSDDIRFSLNNVGISYDEEAREAYADQFSLTTYRASDYVTDVENAAKALAKANGISVEKAKQYINDVNSVARMIATSKGRLDYIDSGLSPFVSNSEYGGSFDFDTSCAKRRMFAGTFAEIQKRLGNEILTAGDYLKIREIMIRDKLEAYCAKCYVEGSRAKMGEYAAEFRKLYKRYYPDRWQPDQLHLVTEEGYEWMRLNHPEAYESVVYFWNNHGTLKEGDKAIFSTQAKPKLFMSHSAYKDEILKNFTKLDEVETEKVKQKNKNGGIRFNSFSDAEIIHIIDAMQALMDMSRVGLAGQAYSKQENFINAFGNTGLKINISIDAWGVDENGNLVFNDVEGVPHEKAFALRKKYSRDVGTILCVYDDAMLKAALKDDRIDFIIPFHRSQWKKSQYKAMGLPDTTKDYTNQQNEKWLNPDAHTHDFQGRKVKTKCENYMPNSYWEYDKDGVYNANKYLDKCAEDGKRPKFYKFLDEGKDSQGRTRYFLKEDGSTDGYWKLLIDFKMYGTGKDGKIDYSYNAKQTAVRPEFNMTNIRKMMKDYTGDGSKLPVAKGIVEEFVTMKENGEVFSLSVDDYIDEKSQEYSREEQKALIESMRDSMDIQYGDRTLPAYYEGLRKANEAVGKYLRRTHLVPESKDIRRVAKAMKSETESTKSVDEIVSKLNALYEYINNDKYVDGDTVSNTAKDIAEWLLGDQKEYYDETEVEHYNELKSAIKAHAILVEDDYLGDLEQYGGYNDVRKKYFGTLNISRTKGRTAEAVVESIREEYPGLIPYESNEYNLANPAGALDYLIERLETEKPKPRMRDVDYDAWTYNVGQMIYEAYFGTNFVPGDQTGQELLAEYRKGLKEFQAESRNEQRYKDRVAEMRKRWAKYRENEDTKATKNAIMRSARRLTTMLNNPTNTKHVPESFRVPLARFLNNIYYGTGITSQRTVDWANMMNVVNKIIANPESTIDDNGTSVFLTVDPDLGGKMEKLTSSIDKVVDLDKLSREELRNLREVFVSISKMIETADKMMSDERKRKVSYFGDGTIEDLLRYKDGKVYENSDGKKNAIGVLKDLTANEMLDSYTRFHTFGTHAEEILHNIQNGMALKVKYLQETEDYVQGVKKELGITDKEIEAWKADETITVGNVEMTVGQVMSLYELMKRPQAKKHVMEGGITHAPFVKKGSLVATTTNGNVRLTTSELSEAIGKLTDKQKEYADRLTRHFQKCAEWGNRTTLAIYGYAKFKDPNYFPIKTDPTTRGADNKEVMQQGQTGAQTTLKNVSAAQNLTPNANNPIILENFFDTFSNHVDTMASYGSLLIPLDDAQKWLGYKMTDNTKVNYRSTVRGSIQNVYGKEAVSYVMKLIKDMNGTGTKGEGYMFASFTSKMKGAAVGFNLSVAIQQPTAYVRALAVMNNKYLLKALTSTEKVDYDLIRKYSYIAQWKDWGFYDINVGKSMQAILIGSTSKMDKLRDASMWLAGKGDEITWGRLWKASEYQVREENKNLEVGTEDYYKEVANVFNNIINRTQVVDSTLNRSNIMRSTNTMMREITAFMGEPMKSYNMLYRAVFDLATATKSEKKTARAGVARATVAFVASATAAALAKSVITAARRGGADREDDYFERYMKLLADELLGNLNPVSMIPYVKDVAEMTENIIKGEEVELPDRSDMAYMKDIAYVVQRWLKTLDGKYTVKSSLIYSTRLVGALTGVAAYGIARDTNALVDTLLEAAGMDKAEYWKLKQERPIAGNVSTYVGVAMRYYAEGNTKLADQIVTEIVNAGVDEDKAHDRIVTNLSKDEEKAKSVLKNAKDEAIKIDALKALYNIKKGDRKNLTRDQELSIIDSMSITDEQKGILYEAKHGTEALSLWKEKGGTSYEYMLYGKNVGKEDLEKLDKEGISFADYLEDRKSLTGTYNAVSEKSKTGWSAGIEKANEDKKITKEEIDSLALEMIAKGYSDDEVGSMYQRQRDDDRITEWGGTTKQYIEYGNEIAEKKKELKDKGEKTEDIKKSVAETIKGYKLSEDDMKLLWDIAGYDVDGTETDKKTNEKKVIEDKNFDKYFK